KKPVIANNVFLAEGSQIIGNVTIGEESSVWYNSVLRGDVDSITIGKRTNIQDLSMIHVNPGQPTLIEDEVSVGHSCVLHGCTIRKGCLIGMGAIILNDSEIGEYSLVGAGSLIPERKKFPPNSLILGTPAKVIRELRPEELEMLKTTNQRYAEKTREYLAEQKNE
ncbi:MAG: gamma carbonic anhydrase family protein, partial [Eubacteriales bacterium]